MAFYKDKISSQTENQHLSKLLDKLTVDDQRTLSKLLNTWDKTNQRKNSRMPCSIVTEYIFNNRSYKGKMKNISLGGAFIRSRQVAPVNEHIFQSFFFPNFEIPIRSNSKIIWIGSQGFGVQFDIIQSDV
ncbi:MAG: PilZ domain-containing protein [Desulfobacterales bacterium]|nr:PilZ domain-containing protein [Desulfobacterales bacterium]